jgi:hypothetical protein
VVTGTSSSTSGRRGREAQLLRAAAARLATLDYYPHPVRTRRVRIVHAPWFFRLPVLHRFRGYELGPFILVRAPLEEVTEDLVTHELCHVWQLQHRPLFWLSYLSQGYRDNQYEAQARRAVAVTRSTSRPGPRAGSGAPPRSDGAPPP